MEDPDLAKKTIKDYMPATAVFKKKKKLQFFELQSDDDDVKLTHGGNIITKLTITNTIFNSIFNR